MLYLLKFLFLPTFVAVVMINFSAPAQNSRTAGDTSFKIFIDEDAGRIGFNLNDFKFLICSISCNKLEGFLKENSITMQRQLGQDVFIISLNRQFSSSDFQLRFRWIKKANTNWKLSPDLLSKRITHQLFFPSSFFVSTFKAGNFNYKKKDKKIVVANTTSANIFIAKISSNNAFNKLLQEDNIFFIATYHTEVKEELQVNNLDLSVNKINQLHSNMPLLKGDGITISIKENLPDTTDIDFAARYMHNPLQAAAISSHATIMATMAAGAGNSWYLGKGVASNATVTSSNFSNLLPDADVNYQQNHISVQNHSYGVGIENFYGADAAAYDASAIQNDAVLFVFSAGNAGNLPGLSGNYAGIPNHANLTGSFKMAKNIITVGAVDSFAVVAKTSSRGPAFDGRVKPELVAFGEDGSSGAAALISGTAAILQEVYKTANNDKLPSAALIKAILLNSADDVEREGIDYTSGYGNLNALKATENLLGLKYFSASVANKASREFSLNIPANISKAKFTLVWNDVPASPNAYKSLVNDLDIQLRLPSTNQMWQPWVLNSFANADSLSVLPVRKRDSLNNAEQITLDNPVAGNYKIVVNGFSVSGTAQNFYIAWQLETINNFSWNFPAASDNIFSSMSNIVKWNTNINATTAKLLFSIDNGNTWQLIDSLINLKKKYFYWNAPDTNALAMLKMQTGAQDFLTDTFTISKKLNFRVGFNCTDSVLWYWNKLPGINSYRIFTLQGNYLQPVTIISDTQFVFDKHNFPYRQFAVSPIIKSRDGVKSYTANYTEQGVDCYISNFLADLQNDNTANIQLQLGTNYFVKKIVFEKLLQGNFVSLKQINTIAGLNYTVKDYNLQKGINSYRVSIELMDGRIIYSYTAGVVYFDNLPVIIFPNPVKQNTIVTIKLNELLNQVIKISDVLGHIVFNQQVHSTSLIIPFTFSKGIYFISVINPETNKLGVYKILVQ